jgi:DNA-binding LacI/PurR family transcriptional regulator
MGKQSEFTGYERYMGFLHAMQTNKLCVDPELVRYGDYKEDSGYINMKDLISLREKGCYFSAVYIVSSKMTYGAISALREMNLSTPGDFSLIGFDVHDEHKLIMPQVTTIVQPEKEIGIMAARLLLNHIRRKKKDSISQRVVLEPILDIKATCRPIQHAD